MTRPLLVLALSTLLLGTSGCARLLEGNQAREARREVPDTWGSFGVAAASSNASARASAQQQWDEFFADPHLRGLIEAALENNQDLDIRVQDIIIARSEVGARQGAYLPFLDAGASAGVEKVGTYTSRGQADEANGVPANLPHLAFGLSASWEIDIWGKLRNAAKAANYRYLASIDAKNFLVTQIIAEIADSYYELVALDNQLDVLDRYIALQQDALAIVRLKKEAARATELAVQRFEAEVLKNQSLRFDLLQRQIEAENRINFLVGRYPQHVDRDSSAFRPTEPPTVSAGIPSDLLDNRPDVRAAERTLAGAKLDVKAAKAQFFPSLSIAAGVGYESFNAQHLVVTPQSLVYNVAGNLIAPLLNRAAIKADYRAANARQVQAVFEFERTLLMAFTEVVNNLAGIENLRNRYARQHEQVETLEAAVDTSNVLYQSARADYMEVLLTRRDALDAEMGLIEIRKAQWQAVVDIYRALGGGWRTE